MQGARPIRRGRRGRNGDGLSISPQVGGAGRANSLRSGFQRGLPITFTEEANRGVTKGPRGDRVAQRRLGSWAGGVLRISANA